MQTALDNLRALFNNGITVADHMNAAVIEIKNVVHGQEALFLPPLRMKKPLAFRPISAMNPTTGADIPIASISGINFATKKPDGTLRKDGYLGVTVQYAPPLGDISLSNFSTATAQANTVDRSVATLPLNPGSWILSANAGLAGVPTGFTLGLMSIFTSVSNGGSDANGARVWSSVAPNGNSDTSLCIAALPVSLSVATQYFAVLRANFTGGSVSGYGRLSALRVAPDPATTGTVTGILVGA